MDRAAEVEGLDTFCDDLAGRIAAGVSVDRVDAEGLLKVAAEIRTLRVERQTADDSLAGLKQSMRLNEELRHAIGHEQAMHRNLKVERDALRAELERKDEALREAKEERRKVAGYMLYRIPEVARRSDHIDEDGQPPSARTDFGDAWLKLEEHARALTQTEEVGDGHS